MKEFNNKCPRCNGEIDKLDDDGVTSEYVCFECEYKFYTHEFIID